MAHFYLIILCSWIGAQLSMNSEPRSIVYNLNQDITEFATPNIDVDEKGGAAISIGHVTGKPILYIGEGQEYGDLKKFDSSKIIESIGFVTTIT